MTFVPSIKLWSAKDTTKKQVKQNLHDKTKYL